MDNQQSSNGNSDSDDSSSESTDEYLRQMNIKYEEFEQYLNSNKIPSASKKQNITFHPVKSKVKRNPRELIILDHFSLQLRNKMRNVVFLDSTINIEKSVLLYYHELIMRKNPLIPRVPRCAYRNIQKYYIFFSSYTNAIINALQELKKEGKINYDEDYERIVQK